MDYEYYLSREWTKEYNCWEFVREIYERELGVNLPFVPIDATDIFKVVREFTTNDIRSLFRPVVKPSHLCLVEMGRDTGSHVGVYCDLGRDGKVLHNHITTGALLQRPSHLNLPIRGYYELRCI